MAKLRPVLTHGDPNRGNGIFTPEKQVVLVDWDNAKGSIWLKDLAYLTYHIDPHEKEKIKRIRESFLKGYGNIEFRPNEIEFISKILDVIKSLELLSYYLNVQKRRRSFDLTKGKLLELLSEF